jgi:hypothetical protein
VFESGRPETGVYPLTIGSKLKIAKASDWSKIRDVRNLCAGHPAKRANGVPATHQIRYELWDTRDPRQPSHPAFNLSAMIKAYDMMLKEHRHSYGALRVGIVQAARFPPKAVIKCNSVEY